MPQLESDLWIAGGYYIDFDTLGQFRIIGPNNHLYMGLIDIPKHKISINEITEQGQAGTSIKGSFTSKSINLYYPAMDDMRTIRELIAHPHGHIISFLELRRQNPAESVPMAVQRKDKKGVTELTFQRNYADSWYRTRWIFGPEVSVRAINRPYKGYKLVAKKGRSVSFTILADTNDAPEKPQRCRLLPEDALDWKVFGKNADRLRAFWGRTEAEITHLVSWKKTSGDRFGTIFPRDWMESILLGHGDIQKDTIDQMLTECLAHVDSAGQGWHEDVVGEYKYEHELSGKDIFDRKMIDIEPLYILCLPYVSPAFWKDKKAIAKLRRVAKYIMSKARTNDAITFKRHSTSSKKKEQEYHRVGDWRDSAWAYKQIHPVIAPFGVNVAHYPAALATIKQFTKQLKVDNKSISSLIKKWGRAKHHYEYTDDEGKKAYALAIYDIHKKKTLSYKKMTVRHLDEAYLYAFTDGSEHELQRFAQNMISEDGFFTKSGPMIIARKNAYGYTTAEYHGLVIWTKQAAFAVKALARHRKIAHQKSWNNACRKLLDSALEKTCDAVLYAFIALHAIPELHYDNEGEAHFYGDQHTTAGSMSKVQLWSAVGFRRIAREYHDFLLEKK